MVERKERKKRPPLGRAVSKDARERPARQLSDEHRKRVADSNTLRSANKNRRGRKRAAKPKEKSKVGVNNGSD